MSVGALSDGGGSRLSEGPPEAVQELIDPFFGAAGPVPTGPEGPFDRGFVKQAVLDGHDGYDPSAMLMRDNGEIVWAGGSGVASQGAQVIEASLRDDLADDAWKELDPTVRKKLERIKAEFDKRAKATQGMDTGERPNWLERQATKANWPFVFLGSEIGERILGKDYELSRDIFYHYLVGDGDPLVFVPPEKVQETIIEKHPRPGHYKVDPYSYGSPDLRNGMGKFELDVVDLKNGKTLYVMTDRYAFPERDSRGKYIWHGFQVGKFSEDRAKELNEQLRSLGEWRRSDGSTERFQLIKTERRTGEYSLRVPQPFLANIGVDFENLGYFIVPTPSRATPSQTARRSSK